jgi:hypothetical protein
MATIDDGPGQLLAGQAQRLPNDVRQADDHSAEEGSARRVMIAQNTAYAQAIWCELGYLTRSLRAVPITGKRRER